MTIYLSDNSPSYTVTYQEVLKAIGQTGPAGATGVGITRIVDK